MDRSLCIHFACLSVWLFFCLFDCIQKTSKRLNRSGLNFVWDLTWSKGRFKDDKKLASNKIRYSLKFQNSRNFFINLRPFFVFVLQWYKEKIFTIEIKNGREAPLSLVNIYEVWSISFAKIFLGVLLEVSALKLFFKFTIFILETFLARLASSRLLLWCKETILWTLMAV